MVRQISKSAPELKAGHPPAGKTNKNAALTGRLQPFRLFVCVCARKVASGLFCFDFVHRFFFLFLPTLPFYPCTANRLGLNVSVRLQHRFARHPWGKDSNLMASLSSAPLAAVDCIASMTNLVSPFRTKQFIFIYFLFLMFLFIHISV